MRRGFTLVELLVSMAIIVILVSMTVAAVNFAASGDRIPGGSRQTQSMILGARDRAIYAAEPRGVRLVLDPDNPRVASSFIFIGVSEPYTRGTVAIEEIPAKSGNWYVREENATQSAWGRMVSRGLLRVGAKIRIQDGNPDRWYTLETVPADSGDGRYRAKLSRPYQPTTSGNPPFHGFAYSVELAPSVLPNEEPRTLPRGIVIDLESSRFYGKIPEDWYAVTDDKGTPNPADDDVTYSDTMDIVFNERGTIHGPLAAKGVVSLVIADGVDVLTGFRVGHGNSGTLDVNGDGATDEREAPEMLLSLFANSGTIITAPPDETDADADGLRDDPFYLAETGGEG